jgi:hypothetical protein
LVELLQYVWPVIYANFPQAELHTYYGMDQLEPQARQHLMMLLGQPGVMDHGRRPMKEIVLEKWRSSFHLYITECQGEVDCISIRESLVTGCIPLISKLGVFGKREGLHFDLVKTQQGYQQIAHGICNLLTKPEFVEMCRQKFFKSKTIMDWNTVAEQWLEHF